MFLRYKIWAEEKTQQLRQLVDLTEDPDLVSSTHRGTNSNL